jgi:hypothetical protein
MSNANSFRQKLNHFTKFSFAMSILQDRRLLLANTETANNTEGSVFHRRRRNHP